MRSRRAHWILPLRYTGALFVAALISLGLSKLTVSAQSPSGDFDVLYILGRWQVPSIPRAPIDYMMSGTPAEQVPGGTFEGQAYYVFANPGAGRVAIHRTFSNGQCPQWLCDHMSSNTGAESSVYMDEGYMGFGYATSQEGTCHMTRWYHPTTGDHAEGFCNENMTDRGYVADPPSAFSAHAFPRDKFPAQDRIVTFSGSQVQVKSNMSLGGAITDLTWNGEQFVNDWDYGRQIQTAAFLCPDCGLNPTEAGDTYGSPNPVNQPNGWAHGSPSLGYTYGSNWFYTKTAPLQFTPTLLGGGANNPVLWRGTFEKWVTLDFSGHPNILQWQNRVLYPSSSYLALEMPSVYLTGKFSHRELYDASLDHDDSDLIPSFGDNSCAPAGSEPRSHIGGAILSTPNGSHALGIYSNGTLAPNRNFAFCKYDDEQTTQTGQYDNRTYKINLTYWSGSNPAGLVMYSPSYIVVGSLATVKAEMRWLATSGY